MQLNIKKYDCANIYVLLRDNVIIGIYINFEDALSAKIIMQNKHNNQYKHKDADDWIRL